MTDDLAFVDTETTGLDADRHEIWEVGLIVDDVEHHWFLPVNLGTADPIALRIGGYYERHPYEQDDEVITDPDFAHPSHFAPEFARLTRGRHLVGTVISFDEERLRKLLREHRACPDWHYHLIDVGALAVGYLARAAGDMEDIKAAEFTKAGLPWRSDELSHAVGVDPHAFDRHTALGDARWAKAIYEAVMRP